MSEIDVRRAMLERIGRIANVDGDRKSKFEKYYGDLVGFGRDILKHDYPDCICELMQSVVDNRITIGKSANGVGKSYCAGDIGVAWLLARPQSKVVLTANPYRQLQNILWPKVVNNVSQNKELFTNFRLREDEGLFDTNDAEHCLLKLTIPTQGSLEEKQGKMSGYHSPDTLFIFDEADAIPEWVYNAIETCMSGSNDRLLCLFNPRHSMGRLYRWEREGGANVVHLRAFDHPNVRMGKNLIPGAVDRDITVQRINRMTRPLAIGESAGRSSFAVPDFLVGVTARDPNKNNVYYPPLPEGIRVIEHPQFSHIVLGEYPAQSTAQLISQDWVEIAMDRWKKYVREFGEVRPRMRGMMGVDIGEYSGDPSAACFRYPNGYVERFQTWFSADSVMAARHASVEYKKRNIDCARVDTIGIGSGCDRLMVEAGCRAVGVKVSWSPMPSDKMVMDQKPFYHLRDQLGWLVREWLQNPDNNAMLPPDDELEEELLAFEYWEDENIGRVRITCKDDIKEAIGRSPNKYDALALTFYEVNPLLSRVSII